MLNISSLHCERDDRILFHDLSFSLDAGEAIQIQGANGSGKSTLLRILSGLNPHFKGQMYWHDRPLHEVGAEYHQGVFYMGHTPAIKRILSPLENLRWFCATQGHGDDSQIRQALTAVGLRGYDDMPCRLLSAGQQRRVSLARLRLSQAPLWILDEPFTALDRLAVEDLEGFLAGHVNAGGALLVTTHHQLQLNCRFRAINLDDLPRPGEPDL
jgi:heme exporter protein A